MRAADEVKVVFVKEFRGDLGSEREGHTTVVLSPSHCVLQEQSVENEIRYTQSHYKIYSIDVARFKENR